MKKIIEAQFDESQVNENELEQLYGGSGDSCSAGSTLCANRHGFLSRSDEDDSGEITF